MVQYFTNTVKLYSSSFFSYAVEQDILDKVSKDFSNLSSLLAQNDGLLETISAPIYSELEQHQILLSAINDLKCCKETTNFILLLAQNKRLLLLTKISQHFDLLYKKHLNKKIVEVISSCSMSEKEIQDLQKQFEEIFSSSVELSLKEDPEIIGGLIVKLDNQMFDASLRTKFENLTSAVTEEIALL